jgi:type VI secretion system protein ImpF
VHTPNAPAPSSTGSVNRVSFAISGTLAGLSVTETVSFDAVLQPSSLHYSINRSARAASI